MLSEAVLVIDPTVEMHLATACIHRLFVLLVNYVPDLGFDYEYEYRVAEYEHEIRLSIGYLRSGCKTQTDSGGRSIVIECGRPWATIREANAPAPLPTFEPP